MELEEQIKRSALGRVGQLGELYDLRNESLSSLSLFVNGFPRDLILSTDMNQTEFEYKFTESISDRFDLIDIEGELQMTVLLGLITLEGSGKFLNCEKKSEKTVSCSLVCRLRTVHEKLFSSVAEILQHFDLEILKSNNYTHLITEITWGANCLMNLEFSCNSECDKQEIRGRLGAEFTKLKFISVSGKAELGKDKSNLLSGQNMVIKVFADVVPETNWPTTVEGYFDFLTDLPGLLGKVNNGKGKPLSYSMIPLSTIRKLVKFEIDVDNFVRKIDEGFLISTIYFFEEIGKMKQKLNDLYELLSESKMYVKDEYLTQVGRSKQGLSQKESDLKLLISKNWPCVKSGEKPLKELIRQIEVFKNSVLNLFSYETYLDGSRKIQGKLADIKKYKSHGIIYLGRGEKFQHLQTSHPNDEFIVLVTSTEIENADRDLSDKTHIFFVNLAAELSPGAKYVVVDFDFVDGQEFMNVKIARTRCFHIKGIRTIDRDMFATYLANRTTDYARQKMAVDFEPCEHKPGNRVALEMICPGYVNEIDKKTRTWSCLNCKSGIEYGFDEHFYCLCGKQLASLFEYRCSDAKHGDSFITADSKFLEHHLSKLRPLKEMNLLVIGQSGVGKSTWINSIVNYLTYDSMEDAKEHGVICTIPSTFTLYDPETVEPYTIEIGKKNHNEVLEAGKSATQAACSYSFPWEGRCVRIIDTPGLGDTRGIDQDKENLSRIIDHLGYLKELHGVCILLKANDNRYNAIFSYCIKELLAHLHRSVTKNIVFCFTNSRSSLYSPGQGSVVLEKVIESLGISKELPIGVHNRFSLDNEAFLFLCSEYFSNIRHDEIMKASFAKSWKISLRETKRLLNTVKTFKPHLLKETITLVTARSRVLSLTKPLAEISKTIQMNIASMEQQKKEIEGSDMVIKNLEGKLHFTQINLKPEGLARPRTVCTSPSCVSYISFSGVDVKEIEYRTHCHTECYLQNVKTQTVNNSALKQCAAMKNGKCQVCGCGYENHMHITYSQKRVESIQENKEVKENMEKQKEGKNKIVQFLNALEAKVEKYKLEQNEIIRATVKFGMFLRTNAITAYNDSVAEYLQYLIDEEEKKPNKTQTEYDMMKNLQKTLERYEMEVKILQDVLQKSEGEREEVSMDDILKLEENLYKLPLTGADIKACVNESRRSDGKAMQYAEVPIHISRNPRRERKINECAGKNQGKTLISRAKDAFNKLIN